MGYVLSGQKWQDDVGMLIAAAEHLIIRQTKIFV